MTISSKKNQKAQVTIFIIIAVFVVAVVAIFFVLRSQQNITNIPSSMEPIYNTFLSCLKDDAGTGISILESNGGYIASPSYEAGSSYMPFSSQLDFAGDMIPYWHYVSGNNIEKEQVPTKEQMQNQLADFIDGKIRQCILSSYYQEGFSIDMGEPSSAVTINSNNVNVDLSMSMSITKGSDSASVNRHKITVNSDLGALYDSALRVYNYERRNLFLENYSIDALRSYAPVDGVDFTCSPETWDAEQIFSDLKQGIEANTLAMSTQGKTKYSKINLPVSQEVRFINSGNWPATFEVNPSQGSVLVANPVGNELGLGVLGLCYVPYHFVYNLRYPVLVQVLSNDEIFQFPMAVVIQGNHAKSPSATAETLQTSDICNHENTMIQVKTTDSSSNPVPADISFQCAEQTCNMGNTGSDGVLQANFPQCVNGFITAKANEFLDADFMYSTTQQGSANIIMDRAYTLGIELNVDGKSYSSKASITFVNDNLSASTIIYPQQNTVSLSEGQYKITVNLYGQSNLTLGTGTYTQCVDTLSGISGFFGITQKKCVDVNVPSQIISSVLAGGGNQDYYISESQLESSHTISINAQSLPVPSTISQLENNYLEFENNRLEIYFK